MSNLTILNTTIRQIDNLFSLNELHKLSGSESKHQPTFFIRLDTTKDLVAEIQKQDPNNQAILSKNGIGTYACKEIVIAYAAWISPQFHLVVLRAFLNQLENSQKTAQIAPLAPLPKTYTAEMTAQDIHSLVWLFFSHSQMNGLLGHLIKPLEAIGSRYAPNVYGNHTEYKRHLKECEPILKHLLDQIKQDKPKEFEQLLHRLTA
ncbi:P22AR C-terminal domain-containing protein [Mannheimia pernigra]|uniref:P22AR C-terminal domain-containing protein n=1 Tax=Mannheimia pernigra TaxID=111844 RepID=UPI00159F5046|nr:P22AR C-terminal domain-containing protein [Mannheimia pernigra]QLB44374.1 KilA-N domain-containing protein [Mannheimia pernigra]QLB44441.1 KilA-N domain-containing protein [Mannheimia pernigra]